MAQCRGKDTAPKPVRNLTGTPEAGLQPVPPGPHAPCVQAVLLAERLGERQVRKDVCHVVTGERQADLGAGLQDPPRWVRLVGRGPHSAPILGSPGPPTPYLVVPGLGVGAQATPCGVCTGLVLLVDIVTGLRAGGVVHQPWGRGVLRPGAQTLTLPPQGVLQASGALGSHVPVRIWVPRVCTVSSCLYLPEPLGAVTPRLGHFLPKDDGRGVLGPEVSLGSLPPHTPHPLLRPSAPTLSTRPRAERQTHLPALGAPGSSGSHSAAGHSRPRGASSQPAQ